MELLRQDGRIYRKNEQGEVDAELIYEKTDVSNVYQITHTWVSDSLRGQGVAGLLMRDAAEMLRQQGAKATPICSYAAGWFEKHPEYGDVLWEGYQPAPPSCPIRKPGEPG